MSMGTVKMSPSSMAEESQSSFVEVVLVVGSVALRLVELGTGVLILVVLLNELRLGDELRLDDELRLVDDLRLVDELRPLVELIEPVGRS